MGPVEKESLLKRCLDEHYDEILNFMYIRINNRSDAEDLTQEAFLAIIKNIHTFQHQSQLRTWVFSIARNVLNSEYRKKSRLKRLLEKVQLNNMFKSDQQNDHENTELFILLEKLSELDRELVILKHYFGFSYEDIANITSLSNSNVGVRLSRAIASLQEMNDERSDGYEQTRNGHI
jgi:RNA polymerase sigma-70 factor (ECF subfamily)